MYTFRFVLRDHHSNCVICYRNDSINPQHSP